MTARTKPAAPDPYEGQTPPDGDPSVAPPNPGGPPAGDGTAPPADPPPADPPTEPEKAKASRAPAKPAKPKGRIETYAATRPDGVEVTVTRNIDTGEHTVAEA